MWVQALAGNYYFDKYNKICQWCAFFGDDVHIALRCTPNIWVRCTEGCELSDLSKTSNKMGIS